MESGLLLLVVQKKSLTNKFGQNKISRMKKRLTKLSPIVTFFCPIRYIVFLMKTVKYKLFFLQKFKALNVYKLFVNRKYNEID